jgi:di/tricarboxylate transporter
VTLRHLAAVETAIRRARAIRALLGALQARWCLLVSHDRFASLTAHATAMLPVLLTAVPACPAQG